MSTENTTKPATPDSRTDKGVGCGDLFASVLSGDCLQVMATMEAGSIDAIITDLPYGTTACKWDSVIPFVPMWEQVRRVLKPNGVFVTTASQPFTSALVMSNIKAFRHEWVWVKNTSSGMMSAGKSPMKRHESIVVFSDHQTTFNPQKVLGSETSQNHSKKRYSYQNKASKLYNVDGGVPFVWSEFVNPHSVLPCNSVGNRDKEKKHPTQKPVSLMRYLVRTYTNPGDTLLDPCCGSGTTGVAAQHEGRNCVLIEREEKYLEITRQRLLANA